MAMRNLPVLAVFFDLDGVVRSWAEVSERVREIELQHELNRGELQAEIVVMPDLELAVRGQIEDEEWRSRIVARVRRRHGRACAGDVRAWLDLVGAPDPDVVRLVMALRGQAPVGLITNATTRVEADLVALGLDGTFDPVVNSSRVGSIKPEPAIFEHAAGLVDAAPARCAFIDDTAGHVAAARELGIHAHQHLDAIATARWLTELGFTLPPDA